MANTAHNFYRGVLFWALKFKVLGYLAVFIPLSGSIFALPSTLFIIVSKSWWKQIISINKTFLI
jgi:hypothetical protein